MTEIEKGAGPMVVFFDNMLSKIGGFSKSQIPLIEDCRLKIEYLWSASGGINY